MNTKQLYDYVLDQSLAVALQVDETDLDKSTPDSDWTVRELLQHSMTELVWLPDILAGKTVDQIGNAHDGDLLGNDLHDSWRSAIEAARMAVQTADLQAVAHLSYADKPVSEYLLESADDILIHAWDLGQAIGVSVVFDKAVAQTLLDHMSTMIDGSGNGLFKRKITVPESANSQTKLLALLGRDENWAEK